MQPSQKSLVHYRRYDNMVRFYVRVLKEGKITMKDVNPRWEKGVREKLAEEGYIINEDGTISKSK